MFKIIKSNDAVLREISENKFAYNYITKEVTSSCSMALLKANNLEEFEELEYNRIYFVLEGELELNIAGEKIKISKMDSVFLEKGAKYLMKGTFNCIVFNQPAFGSL